MTTRHGVRTSERQALHIDLDVPDLSAGEEDAARRLVTAKVPDAVHRHEILQALGLELYERNQTHYRDTTTKRVRPS